MCRAAAAPPWAWRGWCRAAASAASPRASAPAAASLLEAEVVTADGAGAHRQRLHQPGPVLGAEGRRRRDLRRDHPPHPATHALPRPVRRRVHAKITAASDAASERLVERDRGLLPRQPVQPALGRADRLPPADGLTVDMVFQGIDQAQARAVWKPFFDWRGGAGRRLHHGRAARHLALPARMFWDASFMREPAGGRRIRRDGPAPRRTQLLLGRRRRARRARSCTPTSRPGCRRTCCSRRASRRAGRRP